MLSRIKWSVRDIVFFFIMGLALVVACWLMVHPLRLTKSQQDAPAPEGANLAVMKPGVLLPPEREATQPPVVSKVEKPKATPSEPYELIRRSDFMRAPRGAARRASQHVGEESADAEGESAGPLFPVPSPTRTPPSSSGGGMRSVGNFPGAPSFGGGPSFFGGGPPLGRGDGRFGRGGNRGADPSRNYAFTGTVTVNGVQYALIEDLANRDARLVKRGDSAFGMQLTDVSDNAVTVSREGNMIRLAIGENKQDPRSPTRGVPSPQQPTGPVPPNVAQPGGATPAPPTQLNEAQATDLVRQWRENRSGPPPWVTGNYSEEDRRRLREAFERLREQERREQGDDGGDRE